MLKTKFINGFFIYFLLNSIGIFKSSSSSSIWTFFNVFIVKRFTKGILIVDKIFASKFEMMSFLDIFFSRKQLLGLICLVNINCSKIKSFSVVTSFLICPSSVKKFCIISRSITDIWFYKLRIKRNWNNDWFWSFQSITDDSICNLIWVLASRLLPSLPLSLNSTALNFLRT